MCGRIVCQYYDSDLLTVEEWRGITGKVKKSVGIDGILVERIVWNGIFFRNKFI